MTTLSFMGANLVAQQLDWSMTEGWTQGDRAANDFYRPLDTFPERFASFIDLVVGAGFDQVDVWTAQLNWRWATPGHLRSARDILDAKHVSVASYAGGFGATADELSQACITASAIGTRILGGNADALDADRRGAVDVLTRGGTVLALENHPEASVEKMLVRIGDGADGRIATTVDTGWWATQGVSVPEAIEALAGHVSHVHLKDVRAVGAHDCCPLGDGVADIAGCVAALQRVGYDGPISIEHEPDDHDPVPEVVEGRRRVEAWLGRGSGTTTP